MKDSTRKLYHGVWKSFNNFFIRLDVKPDNWEERIILFTGYLIQQNKQSQTIRTYLSGLKAVLKDDGIELNENKYLLTALTRACKLHNDKVTTRLPIQKGVLKLILDQVDEQFFKTNSQPFLNITLKALFSTAYFGLFRVGELTTGTHPVLAKDVHVAMNKCKFLFVLRTSKTHGKDAWPQTVKITSTKLVKQRQSTSTTNETNQFCPYQLLRNYTNIRPEYKSEAEPFFVLSDSSPITPELARNTLKSLLKDAGLNEDLYNFHSLRAGRAVDLLKMNLDVETIKQIGRWRSNSVFTYLKNL